MMLTDKNRRKLHTDCEHFEWEIEEDVNVISYDRIEVDVTYIPSCKAGQPISACKSSFCPLYLEGLQDSPYPGVKLETRAYG